MVARLGSQSGKVGLGCLFSIFVLVAGIWVGINAFEVYWRYYRLQDFVREQAGFATLVSNDVILRRLVAYSDSLDVPIAARAWQVRRSSNPREIRISAEYRDSIVIELLGIRKAWNVDFKPGARLPL